MFCNITSKTTLFVRPMILLLALYVLPGYAKDNKRQVDKPDAIPPPNSSAYSIGSGDVLQVNVWKENELGQKLVVRPDGMISLPLIGDVQASGSTTEELSKFISDKLKTYLNNPQVTVIVLEVHSKFFVVMGEVAKPGPYPLARRITILEAISQAGGFKEFAKTGKVYVLHNDGSSTTRSSIHYKQLLKGRVRDNGISNGDTIVVP